MESEWRQGPFSLLLGAIYTKAEIDRDAVDPTLKGSYPRHQANLLFNARPQVEFGSLTIGTQVNGTTSSLAQDGNPLNQPGYVIVSPHAQYPLTQRARVMLNIFNGGRGQDGADPRQRTRHSRQRAGHRTGAGRPDDRRLDPLRNAGVPRGAPSPGSRAVAPGAGIGDKAGASQSPPVGAAGPTRDPRGKTIVMRMAAFLLLLLGAVPSMPAAVSVVAPASAQEVLDTDPNVLAPSKDPTRVANGLAMTPPMGWNSWNRFACTVNERVIRATADAIATNGMKDAGYDYVVIDDCWHGPRDANGFITEDRARFPAGLKALADYVHARGLKFGIYSDAGTRTCGGRPGSQGHEYQDALQYARWGVDYLKYDWCSSGVRNAEEAYATMADALKATGRPILFSLCEWGNSRPWLWADRIGNMWRTTGDITDKWTGKHGHSWGIASIVDMNEPLWPFAGPGHWNDPDMLEVGNGGLTDTEYRAHFSLWAMMAAPLIAGNDVATMSAATRDILLNREVIAVDQDVLGQQGRRVMRDGTSEVWVRQMADGGRALLLWNRGKASARIAADWIMMGLPATLRLRGRDLWTHRELGRLSGRYAATVASHGVVMVRLRP